MRVAVLGGGFQGACVALELARKGVEVDLFERENALVTQAGARNEGKIHLGYVYAGDRTFATARTMIDGALAFVPIMRRLLGRDLDRASLSSAFVYLVHAQSMIGVDSIRRHFSAVTHELASRTASGRAEYFGRDLRIPHRELTLSERHRSFASETVLAAIETQEVSIDPVAMAQLLRHAIAATPSIRVWLGTTVLAVTPNHTRIEVAARREGALVRERFDHVVNALWEGRIAIDRSAGLPVSAPQVYRCKYGMRIAVPEGLPSIPSVTIMLGGFGDVVNFQNGDFYLSWYPACLHGISVDSQAQGWDLDPHAISAARIAFASFDALSGLVSTLALLPRSAIERASVKGGIIVARGQSDIVDPHSGLHRRYEIGLESHGNHHSIDTGKYTMAPLFAQQTADRICGPGAV